MTARPLTPLVDEAETWGTVQWWRLELRSLDDAPFAQRAVAVMGPKDAWSKEYGRPSVGGCLQTLAYIVAISAPAVAAIFMLRWFLEQSGDIPLDIAGWLTGISVLITVASEMVYARRPRAVSSRTVFQFALEHIIPGLAVVAFAAISVANGAYDPRYDPSLWWLLPSILDILVHTALWIRGSSTKDGPKNPIQNIERSIQELSDDVATRIRAARDEAIVRLRDLQKIDAVAAERALQTDLGKLALTMAPEGRSAYYPARSEPQA